jgi:hypothetical protein
MSKKVFIFLIIFFSFLIFNNFGNPKGIEVLAITSWTEPESCSVEKGGCWCASSPIFPGYHCGGTPSCVVGSCPDRPNTTKTNTCTYTVNGDCGAGNLCGTDTPIIDVCRQNFTCDYQSGACEYECLKDAAGVYMYENCDGNNTTGCETDIYTDENNCGGCGIVCDIGYICDQGQCVFGPNLSGWAWSENVGWISFNCNSLVDTDGDGIGDEPLKVCDGGDNAYKLCNIGNPEAVDCGIANCVESCSLVNYGVYVDETTGDFSGYAWSENIGWISFNRTETGNPPAPPFDTTTGAIAKLDLTDDGSVCGQKYWVCGWARALAYGDGWDGWIKLRKDPTDGGVDYGVWLDITSSPHEFREFAWGSDVVGWISFNDLDTGAPVDYQVITSLMFNSPPYVEPGSPAITGEPEYCNNSPTGQISLEWIYQDVDGDNQAQYHLQVATDSGFTNLVVDSYNSQTVSPGGTGTSTLLVVPSPTADTSDLDIAYNNSYYWQVRVQAATGNLTWSDWEPYDPNGDGNPDSFTTSLHAWPHTSFSYSPTNPGAGDTVYFTDESICYDSANNSYSCSEPNPDTGTYNDYLWDFGDGETSTTRGDVTHVYSELGTYTVALSITDNVGTCTATDTVEVVIPVPQWKEIPPW